MKKVIKKYIGYFFNLYRGLVGGFSIKSSEVHYSTIVGRGAQVMNKSFVSLDSIIGQYTYIGKRCNITKATIGNYTSIGDNVQIGSGEHGLDHISTSQLLTDETYEELTKKDCTIGDNVWVGVNAVILRGVIINEGAVVAAGAVVTKSVPPYTIVAGVPAKRIRIRFDAKRVEKLLEIDWSLRPSEIKEQIKSI